MDALPREILLELFAFLNARDLLALTLVCRHFNDIVSNSKRIMDRLTLRFSNRASEKRLVPTRKYTRIHALHGFCVNFLHALESFGANLWYLRMVLVRVDLCELKTILRNCPNLKRLACVNVHVEFSECDVFEPLPALKLDTLSTNGDRRFLKLFMNSSVRELTTFRIHNSRQELKILQQFLRKQKNLKKLELTNFREDFRIFESSALSDVEFQLDELKLHTFTPFDTHHFEAFVSGQKATLRSVTLKQDKAALRSHASFLTEVLEIFRGLKSLRDIHLCGFDLLAAKSFPQIESLELEDYFKIDPSLHEKFPSVRHLQVSHCRTLQHLEKFTRLETLTISHFRWEGTLKLGSVRTLDLSEVIFVCQQPLDEVESKVKRLTMTHCELISWLVDFLKSDKVKLEFLRVEDSRMRESNRKCIEKLSREKNFEAKIMWNEKSSRNDDEPAYNDDDTESDYFGEHEGEEMDVDEEATDEEMTEESSEDDLEELENEYRYLNGM